MMKKRMLGRGSHWEVKRAARSHLSSLPSIDDVHMGDDSINFETYQNIDTNDNVDFEFDSFNNYASVQFNSMIAFAASVLPEKNFIIETLNSTSKTSYYFRKLLKSGCGVLPKCDILEIKVCKGGCTPFIGTNLNLPRCLICHNRNGSSENSMFNYLPLRQRLLLLLTSDLRPFFDYPTSRRMPSPLFSEDILDGSIWKHLVTLIGPSERLIGLQMCWDGVDQFNFSGKSMWPLAYSIVNFPSDLRNKLFISLFVAALCEGNLSSYLHICCICIAH